MQQLNTPYQVTNPHEQYPRPQLVRASYLNLNGKWKYAFRMTDKLQSDYQGDIIVPFSPESSLSGVNKKLAANEFLHYFRRVKLSKDFNVGRIILHIGAVDQTSSVYINSKLVATSDNGYLPLAIDISNFVVGDTFDINVVCRDITDKSETLIGKQREKNGGIWYTAQSGIWQTVWCESVPTNYIKSVRYTPNIDNSTIQIDFNVVGDVGQIKGKIEDKKGNTFEFGCDSGSVTVQLKDVKLWSPDSPNLYDITISTKYETLTSYFGMRKFGKQVINGYNRLTLNNKPIFYNGLLDQGYYPDGLLTPPSDKAMLEDIKLVKELGFNMLRKHIKIEPMRWYYYCDTLGIVVWQDMVNGGRDYSFWTTVLSQFLYTKSSDKKTRQHSFGRFDESVKEQFNQQLSHMIDLLYNVVSIAVWVPFNEGWGQFDALATSKRVARLDSTRLIDHASGWHDQGGGDFRSLHVYFRRARMPRDKRIVALTEYGGYSQYVEGHSFSDKIFGYKVLRDKRQLCDEYAKMFKRDVIDNVKKGLSATVYTQLSDVEQEVNGLITYDRKVVKFDKQLLIDLNSQLLAEFDKQTK